MEDLFVLDMEQPTTFKQAVEMLTDMRAMANVLVNELAKARLKNDTQGKLITTLRKQIDTSIETLKVEKEHRQEEKNLCVVMAEQHRFASDHNAELVKRLSLITNNIQVLLEDELDLLSAKQTLGEVVSLGKDAVSIYRQTTRYSSCRRCSFCQKVSEPRFMKCGGCFNAVYCSTDCQRSHWAAHACKCHRRFWNYDKSCPR